MWWKRKKKPDPSTPREDRDPGYRYPPLGGYTPIIPPGFPEFPDPPKGGSGISPLPKGERE